MPSTNDVTFDRVRYFNERLNALRRKLTPEDRAEYEELFVELLPTFVTLPALVRIYREQHPNDDRTLPDYHRFFTWTRDYFGKSASGEEWTAFRVLLTAEGYR